MSTGPFIWPNFSSPAVAEGVVYVGSDRGGLYAFKAADGTPMWNHPTGPSALSSPTVANGVVYVGSSDNNLYAFTAPHPTCSAAQAKPPLLWSPHHQLVPIAVTGVTDPDGHTLTITVTGVTQDEPVNAKGDGNTSPDAVVQAGVASVRAERAGSGNGRVYLLSFKADDGQGGVCTGVVTVSVPHSLKKWAIAIDDGQLYDSTISGHGQRPPQHRGGSHGNDDDQVNDSTIQ